MKRTRNDTIGGVCAIAAIMLIALLSWTSWRMDDCRTVAAQTDQIGQLNCSPIAAL